MLASASLVCVGLTSVPATAADPERTATANGPAAPGPTERLASTAYATGVDTPAEARRVERFHTASAGTRALLTADLPEGRVVSRSTGTVPLDGPPGSVAPVAPSQAWAKGLPDPAVQRIERAFAPELAAGTVLHRSVGKVEFTDPRQPTVTQICSGAAINSPSKMMVATAGHCVAVGGSGNGGPPDTDRIWMKNWVFIPAYNTNGQTAPYGRFTAKSFRAFDYWLDGGGSPYDFALVTVNPNAAGQRVVDAVGGNGLSWNYTHEEDLTIVGYPVFHDYGNTQYQHAGRTKTSTENSANIMMEGSGFDGGGSGGPWLRTIDPLTNLGKINGVTSGKHKDSSGNNDSPHFGGDMKWLWDQQGSVT
ncbi:MULTISPECIES: trypsin-like serine peptidase [unclassified Streptomyces]|uniref:trypsin-like serine peptidase n=1 Tax=unclassified Streptomyces TaxID=2593676 RepID=UPI00381FB6FC